MRIGLTGGAGTVDRLVAQAQQAEADGFSALWFASSVLGDPLTGMAIAGRATSRIELGTAVLQTYPVHPLLQANRVAAAANAMDRPGLTLGIGPSHRPLVEDVFGLSYDHPGRSTEEYLGILTALLQGRDVDVRGEDWTTRSEGRMVVLDHPVPVLLSALSPRLLRVAGEVADGTVLWMATAQAIETTVAPAIQAAAAGRPAPRIVAGLPVAVHDDLEEARAAVTATAGAYGSLPNYRRILDSGGAADVADAAIIGDEAAVTAGLHRLIDAGATDIWANIVPVGPDRRGSRQRTSELLQSLL